MKRQARGGRSPTATTPGGPQYNYEASGLGDIALITRHWVLDIDRCKGGNYSIGFGVKAPTGKNDVAQEREDVREHPERIGVRS